MCLAIPVKVVELDESGKFGKVDYLGTTLQASFDLLPSVGLGDWVIVHAGFAISKLDEAEARETLDLFRELAERSEAL